MVSLFVSVLAKLRTFYIYLGIKVWKTWHYTMTMQWYLLCMSTLDSEISLQIKSNHERPQEQRMETNNYHVYYFTLHLCWSLFKRQVENRKIGTLMISSQVIYAQIKIRQKKKIWVLCIIHILFGRSLLG